MRFLLAAMNRRLMLARPTVTILGLALLAGCGGQPANKVGATKKVTAVVLTMTNTAGDSYELGSFATAVEEQSGGALRIRFRDDWRSGTVGNESGVIRDVVAGRVDLAWAGTRAFDSVGVTSFDALHAPLLIDSYPLQGEVLGSPLAARMLAGLERLGLVGIAILPGPLRKPLGVARLRGPGDYHGRTLGIARSAVAADTLRTLGATAKEITDGGRIGGLDGVEQHVVSIDDSHYDKAARYLTANVNLWPRPQVVFMSERAFAALSTAQHNALARAAKSALAPTLADQQAGQKDSGAILCRRGVTFTIASPEDLAALRRAVEPVYVRLARDPFTSSAIAQIRGMRSGSAAVPDTMGCANTGSRGEPGRVRTEIDGRYVMTTTAADLRAIGAQPADINPDNYGVFVTVLDRGRFTQEQPRNASAAGTYTVVGDTLELTVNAGKPGPETETRPGEVFTCRWSTYHDHLRLYAVPGKVCPEPMRARPWRRIGDAP